MDLLEKKWNETRSQIMLAAHNIGNQKVKTRDVAISAEELKACKLQSLLDLKTDLANYLTVPDKSKPTAAKQIWEDIVYGDKFDA